MLIGRQLTAVDDFCGGSGSLIRLELIYADIKQISLPNVCNNLLMIYTFFI